MTNSFLSSLGTLVQWDIERGNPGTREVLYQAKRGQLGTILLHPTDKTLLAVTEASVL